MVPLPPSRQRRTSGLASRLISWVFRLTGLYPTAYRNFSDLQVRRNRLILVNLPAAFEGVQLLHLSDLHLDLDSSLLPALLERLTDICWEACVITGDFISRDQQACVAELKDLRPHLGPVVYAVLGNHDSLALVDDLERLGIQVLLDQTVAWERSGDRLYLSGAVNPYLISPATMARMRHSTPAGGCSLLLAHSPDSHVEASRAGFDGMLAGHTHAGQICLPGGFPLVRNCRAGRAYLQGAWNSGAMHGYTSSGTGSCTVPLRLFCPPEIVLHRLSAG